MCQNRIPTHQPNSDMYHNQSSKCWNTDPAVVKIWWFCIVKSMQNSPTNPSIKHDSQGTLGCTRNTVPMTIGILYRACKYPLNIGLRDFPQESHAGIGVHPSPEILLLPLSSPLLPPWLQPPRPLQHQLRVRNCRRAAATPGIHKPLKNIPGILKCPKPLRENHKPISSKQQQHQQVLREISPEIQVSCYRL